MTSAWLSHHKTVEMASNEKDKTANIESTSVEWNCRWRLDNQNSDKKAMRDNWNWKSCTICGWLKPKSNSMHSLITIIWICANFAVIIPLLHAFSRKCDKRLKNDLIILQCLHIFLFCRFNEFQSKLCRTLFSGMGLCVRYNLASMQNLKESQVEELKVVFILCWA